MSKGVAGYYSGGVFKRLPKLFAQAGRYGYLVPGMILVSLCVGGVCSPPVLAEQCPNSSLRAETHSTQLPDCRAFELISPPYKDGYFPFFEQLSPDGDHSLFLSLGTFDDAKGNYALEGTLYESSRTSAGWAVKPVSPPASTFAFANWYDASRDLSQTLWAAHTTSQSADAEDFYIRRPDGTFVRVGPQLPPELDKSPPAPFESRYGHELKYAGASPDLSHVFFEIENVAESGSIVWSGDKTLDGASGVRSLYEYVGTGNSEPKLVGVLNKGSFNHNNEAEMITQCGVDLGGGGPASVYNAISSSGRTVFFTANAGECENENEELGSGPEVNEIYARMDESETVDISEPSANACVECNTASRERAFFEGASKDGTKAFFLSQQENLLPGAEGMNLYEYDFENPPQHKLVRISGQVTEPQVQGVARIADNGTLVYFVAKGVLAANQTVNGEEAKEGSDNFYVSNTVTGETSFIGILLSSDSADWKRPDERPVQATPDGNFMIFPSHAHLTSDDNSAASVAQLFEYDAETGELVRISAGQKGDYSCLATGKTEEGYNCNGNTADPTYAPSYGSRIPRHENVLRVKETIFSNISADGKVVIFESFNPLAPQAVNSLSSKLCSNVYEYRWAGQEGIKGGNVSLVSDGQDAAEANSSCGSPIWDVDSSGENIVITSTDHLVSQDKDTQRDYYDARGGGGFAAAVPQPSCEGDACQGSLSLAPQLISGNSDVAASPGGNGGNAATPRISTVAGKVRVRPLTRAQRLAKALVRCRKAPKKTRGACVIRARKRYGTKAVGARSSSRRGRVGMRNGGSN